MPKPSPGESRSTYISRCIREVMGEGTDQEAAVGKCEGMWSSYAGKAVEGELFDTAIGESADKGMDSPQIDPADTNVAFPTSPEEKIQARRELVGHIGADGGATMPRMPEEDMMAGKELALEQVDGSEDDLEWEEAVLGTPLPPEVEKEMHEMEESDVEKDQTRDQGGKFAPSSTAERLAAHRENAKPTEEEKRENRPNPFSHDAPPFNIGKELDKTLAVLSKATDELNEDNLGREVAHLGPVAGEIRRVVREK
jgi:hypothetical protein